MKNKHTVYFILLPVVVLLIVIGLFGGYSWWNKTNPEKTCASCHEIQPMVGLWQQSAHRNMACTNCHGTALSNGFHSLKEKSNMVFSHVKEKPDREDIRLTEQQVLALMDKCTNCHQSEFAQWKAGGHSVTYNRIFMDSTHNAMEKPYWDCFRCHGMFYDGNIHQLMDLTSSDPNKWKLKQSAQGDLTTIPCLACHQIHTENEPLSAYQPVKKENQLNRSRPLNLYIRTDKRYRLADDLFPIVMIHNGDTVQTSNDAVTKLCIQCHSPNFSHQTGSEDDRTPRGVHEGLACTACHQPHSNNASRSCSTCHPAISNCGIDVTTMNTTYRDSNSPNNIHWVRCNDCHQDNRSSRYRKE